MILLSSWFSSYCLDVVAFDLLWVDVGVTDFVRPKPKDGQIGTELGRIDITGDNDGLKGKLVRGVVDARKLDFRDALSMLAR